MNDISQLGEYHETGLPSKSQPPLTDRGVQITAKIDFLTFTTVKTLIDVKRVICSFSASHLTPLRYGFNGYREQLVGVAGIKVGYTPGRDDICVSIPGEACTLIGDERLFSLVKSLNGRLSRLDYAFDTTLFTVAMVDKAWRAGNINSRVNPSRGTYKFFQTVENGVESSTVYIGSRKSETCLRVYDRRGPTRLELELKGKRASSFWVKLSSEGLLHLPVLALGVVRSHIDFVNRVDKSKNVTRSPLLPWWKRFIGDVAKVKLSIPKPVLSIERLERHVMRQSASFMTLLEVKREQGHNPDKVLNDLLVHGFYNMGAKHRSLVKMASV